MLKAAIEPVLPARMAVLFGLRGAGPSPPCHYVKGIVGGARGRLHCAALLCTALLCTARPRRVPAAPAGRGRAVRCGAVRSGLCALGARSPQGLAFRAALFHLTLKAGVLCVSAGDWKLSARCVSFFLKCFFPEIRVLFLSEAAVSLRYVF